MVKICSCQYRTFNRVFDLKHKLNFAWQASKAEGWGEGKNGRTLPLAFFPSPPLPFFCLLTGKGDFVFIFFLCVLIIKKQIN